jgi:hypothetical protein
MAKSLAFTSSMGNAFGLNALPESRPSQSSKSWCCSFPGSARISLSSAYPGAPPQSSGGHADAHLAGLDRLAALGVTWIQVGLPGDSVGHVQETLERYGELVIAHA